MARLGRAFPNRARPPVYSYTLLLAAPTSVVAPTVSGATTVGSTLSNDNGSWLGAPTSYTYQWTRDGSNIAAATSSTYATQAADVGHVVGVKVTATNAAGSSSATSSSNTITVVAANTDTGGGAVAAAIYFQLLKQAREVT